jgi:AraC-like DNA-binding protein
MLLELKHFKYLVFLAMGHLVQRIQRSALLRHLHRKPYAALVLSGSYEEAGDLGRVRVCAGDVVLHEAFEAHLDRFPRGGAAVLNLPLPASYRFEPGLASVEDPDALVHSAERDVALAAAWLVGTARPRVPECLEWPDELAAELLRAPSLSLSTWCHAKGLRPWSLTRGFSQVFGVSPSAFRARSRTRRALRCLRQTDEPLSDVAARLGFADQSHLTRSVTAMTGLPPQAWRRAANGFKTR